MRIDQTSLAGVDGAGSSSSIGSTAGGLRSGLAGEDRSDDSVKLSGASSLISLAKQVGASDKQSRIAALADQFRSGSYQADLAGTGRAIVQQLA